MRRTILTAGLATSLLMLGACDPQPDRSESSQPPRLATSEIAEALEAPDLFFLDVRSAAEIEELGTLEGYVNIPIDELESRLEEVPRDRPILTA